MITVAQARAQGVPEAALVEGARHAQWRKGDLRYLLHAGQRRAKSVIEQAHSRGIDAVLNTGRQYGKSRLLCAIAAEACIRQPETRIPYAAPTEKQVEEFIQPHWRRMEQHAPPELKPVWSTKRSSWEFPNGSRVVIAGCEDIAKADRLRGPRAHMCILDEAGFVPIADHVVKSILGWQLATTGGQMIIASTPPESTDHPFVEYVREAKADDAYFHATVDDAPHITPEMRARLVKRCGGEHTLAWRREGLAEILRDPEQVVLPEWGETCIEARDRPAYFLPHAIGDLGYVDMTVIAFGYFDFENDTDVIEHELAVRHTRSDEIRQQVAEMESAIWPRLTVHRRKIDAPPIVRADLSREHDDERQRWDKTRKDDLHAAVNALRVRLSNGKLKVHPRCKTIIAHAEFGRWNKQRTAFERPETGKHHYDGLAALVYFQRGIDRMTNPFPQLMPGVSLDTHHIPAHLLDARTKLERIFRAPRRRR